jgi:putative DNA methylase
MDDSNQSISSESDGFRPVKAETILPTKTVGIECLKEANPETMSPHRNIFKWFARRPTAATRLALLASILPEDTTNDELLKLMCIGPNKELNGSISDYVLQKYSTKDDRDGSIEKHFGYEYPHRQVPSEEKLAEFHEELKQQWGGELPTVLDPTSGGGTIPLESLRYGLPTIANELNPVAWLLNKVILDYAPTVGSIKSDVDIWMKRIETEVQKELKQYFPERSGIAPDHYYRAYSIACPSCGERLPISNRWYFNRRREAAIYPVLEEGDLEFQVINPTEVETREGYDPSSGSVSGGDAECPFCGVVTERSQIVDLFNNGEFEFEVCGLRYEKAIGGTRYHAPTEADKKAIQKAREKIESDLHLSTLLATERYEGYYDRAVPYGITQWRDVYSPRQLLTHAMYLEAFNSVKSDVLEQHSSREAELILTLLSFISVKLIRRNSRLNPITADYGSPDNMLGNNNFSFQWHFGESNLMTGTYSYQSEADNVLESYEETVGYVKHIKDAADVHQGDAGDLPLDDSSIQSVVIDPPYGDNIMYSEIADAFHVWLREYLGDIFADAFTPPETNKTDEAVENPVIVNPREGQSTAEAARERYEEKMRGIFSEVFRVLQPGGTLTIYFTDKEVNAWDSLTMSIIRSGFIISATHTITSEVPNRIGVQKNASADSTLLLTCRKPKRKPENRTPTLWRDIKHETRSVAREKAAKLLESDYNLTKTDMIISAFGPTLRVFTQEYPVVDDKDNPVRPKEALTEARAAVTEVIIDHELSGDLETVDSLSTWYILTWLVYESESIPYDEARQLGLGVGVQIDDIKQKTKIWSKSRDDVVVKGQDYRIRDFTALEVGEKRRKRAYPVDPTDTSFDYDIDAVHATLNVLQTKGSDFAWNWLQDRDLQNSTSFKRTIESLIQVLPEEHPDRELLVNLASGETGELLDIDQGSIATSKSKTTGRTTLQDFQS